jgi:apolipoprotein N-acyltransferase
MQMKNKTLIILLACFALITGWQSSYFWVLLIIAFIPLVYLIEERSKFKLFLVYFIFVVWYGVSVFWVLDVNTEAAIAVWLIYPIFILVPFLIYKFTLKKYNYRIASFVFIATWLSIEYMHHNWGFGSPYMTLGNGLAGSIKVIQWYEYTGVLGGSLWVITINFLLYGIIRKVRINQKIKKVHIVTIFCVVLIPIAISLQLNKRTIENTKNIEVVSVHTNADCYNFKYKVAPRKLINHYLKATLSTITEKTAFIVWPETAIKGKYWISEKSIKDGSLLKYIKDTIALKSPNANIISGIFLNQFVSNNDKIDAYAHFNKNHKIWYYKYNGAINIDPQLDRYEYRTKQKLVPMEESTPYPSIMSGLKGVVKSLGNFNFYYEKEDGKVFYNRKTDTKASMLICYESLFGEEVSKHSKNGAEVLFVGLNEGWYKNIKAASDFNRFGILRAIENRKFVVRSSNDGISSIIDTKGNIIEELSDFRPGALRVTVGTNKKITFYAKHGDYLGRYSVVLLVLLLVSHFIYKYSFRTKNSDR